MTTNPPRTGQTVTVHRRTYEIRAVNASTRFGMNAVHMIPTDDPTRRLVWYGRKGRPVPWNAALVDVAPECSQCGVPAYTNGGIDVDGSEAIGEPVCVWCYAQMVKDDPEPADDDRGPDDDAADVEAIAERDRDTGPNPYPWNN